MAECKMCGRKGFFAQIYSNGLCKMCYARHILALQQRKRIIDDSMRLAENGKTFKTRLSRCDLLIEHAKFFYEYERRGVPTFTPLPSQLIEHYSQYRDEIVIESARDTFENALAKAGVATTATKQASLLTKALMEMVDYKKEIRNPRAINEMEQRLKTRLHDVQADDLMEKARKAEFRGDAKKAAANYKELLYFVTNDEIPDALQVGLIQEVESKIAELEGRTAPTKAPQRTKKVETVERSTWKCEKCGKLLSISTEYKGRLARCPGCSHTMRVP